MQHQQSSPPLMRRVAWNVLSFPLFLKIMGIGLVMAAVFGSVTLIQIRVSVSSALHQTLEERTRTIASSLVANLERPTSTGDLLEVSQKIDRTRKMFPDVRYVIVRDTRGRVLEHTFAHAIPADLLGPAAPASPKQATFRVYGSDEGLIFDVVHPILEGDAGTLEVGVTDAMVSREIASTTRTVLWTLMLCTMIGAGLAVVLTHILTRPIRHLVDAVNEVREGNFAARSAVFSADEIGRLAVAFNEMTGTLLEYRATVAEKERARAGLIDKLVHAQEEERQKISRELHDELGQSLLALLLKVEAMAREHAALSPNLAEVNTSIRALIDDVGRLAWGVRPSILDDYGLDSALARHVEELSRHSDLDIDYQYTRPSSGGRLPRKIEVALYRIAQESFANIVKHAHARHASAVVLQQPHEVTLLIEDDGCGFDVDAANENCQGCFGLTGMEERAALLGGTCTIESTAGQGTTVRVQVPWNANS